MKKYLFLTLLISFTSCIYNHTDNIEILGNRFYYLGDGNESQILYDPTENVDYKFGITVIPPEVIKYNFNDQYIIAKTLDSLDSKRNYWLVDKTKDFSSLMPLDSINFYRKLDSLAITLKLKEKK